MMVRSTRTLITPVIMALVGQYWQLCVALTLVLSLLVRVLQEFHGQNLKHLFDFLERVLREKHRKNRGNTAS